MNELYNMHVDDIWYTSLSERIEREELQIGDRVHDCLCMNTRRVQDAP